MNITPIILLVTASVSYLAFQSPLFMQQAQLNPYRVVYHHQWYRLFTHAFVHANYTHLLVNLFVLYSFGQAAEQQLCTLRYEGYIEHPALHFILLYLGGIFFSVLTTLVRYHNHPEYNAVGASGATSAVVFMTFFFAPWEKIYFFALVPVPGIFFGLTYLIYSHYMSRRNTDNINHDAHLAGAVFGFIYPLFIWPGLYRLFIQNLLQR